MESKVNTFSVKDFDEILGLIRDAHGVLLTKGEDDITLSSLEGYWYLNTDGYRRLPVLRLYKRNDGSDNYFITSVFYHVIVADDKVRGYVPESLNITFYIKDYSCEADLNKLSDALIKEVGNKIMLKNAEHECNRELEQARKRIIDKYKFLAKSRTENE